MLNRIHLKEHDIQRRLGDEHVVSVSPDLPDVTTGADYMVGGNEQVFVPKYRESNSLEKLLVGLALSRLALPKHTLCLSLVDTGQLDAHRLRILRSPINALRDLDDIPAIVQIRILPNVADRVPDIPEDMRNYTTHLSALLFEANQQALLKSVELINEGSHYQLKTTATSFVESNFLTDQDDQLIQNSQIVVTRM